MTQNWRKKTKSSRIRRFDAIQRIGPRTHCTLRYSDLRIDHHKGTVKHPPNGPKTVRTSFSMPTTSYDWPVPSQHTPKVKKGRNTYRTIGRKIRSSKRRISSRKRKFDIISGLLSNTYAEARKKATLFDGNAMHNAGWNCLSNKGVHE